MSDEVPVADEQVQERLGGEGVGLLERLCVLVRVGEVRQLLRLLLGRPGYRLLALLDHVQVLSRPENTNSVIIILFPD